ncbi:MAG TPA: ABC transporter permease [Candidatus Nanopelagicales bacterium]|nr:ABC transporter permease [Candidatus Nanopelagicales bacterium]
MSELERPSAGAATTPAHPVTDSGPGARPAGDGGATPGRLGRLASALVVPVLAVFTALVIGALVIVFSDQALLALWTSDPIGAFGESIRAVAEGYGALFTGALGSPEKYAAAFASGDINQIIKAFNPISESLLAATPLIFTGLAVALGFRSGLFNIGAEGQLYLGAVFATFVGFSIHGLPLFIHLPLAIGAGFLGGALWGFIPGLLKARTGAHEVIVTIMLNYVSYQLVNWVLRQAWYQRPGRPDPVSPIVNPSAIIPPIIDGLRLHWGFVLALLAAAFVSWLLYRSTLGFEFRAVGFNPSAAKYAGISISKTLVLTMAICGGLAGLAGATEILGVNKALTPGFSPGYGFDGIAIALLGGSSPLGVVLAAILFGVLRAGATPMQAATGIPIDLVVVIQALVIMFVAAPALIREIYRIKVKPTTGTEIMAQGWRT